MLLWKCYVRFHLGQSGSAVSDKIINVHTNFEVELECTDKSEVELENFACPSVIPMFACV